MRQCQRCQGFVPEGSSTCPNCSSTHRWWAVPLAFAGAGLASVTLSACYGPPCAAARLPDGGRNFNSCLGYDCTAPLADGGVQSADPEWQANCLTPNGGKDGG